MYPTCNRHVTDSTQGRERIAVPLFNEVDGDVHCLPDGFVYAPTNSHRSARAQHVLATTPTATVVTTTPLPPSAAASVHVAVPAPDAYNDEGHLLATEPNGVQEVPPPEPLATWGAPRSAPPSAPPSTPLLPVLDGLSFPLEVFKTDDGKGCAMPSCAVTMCRDMPLCAVTKSPYRSCAVKGGASAAPSRSRAVPLSASMPARSSRVRRRRRVRAIST